MKKFILDILKFGLLTLVIYIVGVICFGELLPQGPLRKNLKYPKGGYGHLYSRLIDLKTTQDSIDVLVLGSSHAYRGFDPRIFKSKNINLFNLGSGAQTPKQTLLFLHRYLSKLKPNHIIYEVYPGTFCSDGVESTIDILANDELDFEISKQVLLDPSVLTINTLIYSTYSSFFDTKFEEPAIKENDTYIQGGFVEKKINYFKIPPKKGKKLVWKIKDKQMNAFEEILTLFASQNIKFTLIQAPVTKHHFNQYKNNDDFDKKMKKYGDYFNFNSIMLLNDSLHFYDSHHLNQNGVELFNEKLLEKLQFD